MHLEHQAVAWGGRRRRLRSWIVFAGELERIRDLVTDDFVDQGSPVQVPPGADGYIEILTFVTQVLQVRTEVHDVVAVHVGTLHR